MFVPMMSKPAAELPPVADFESEPFAFGGETDELTEPTDGAPLVCGRLGGIPGENCACVTEWPLYF